MKLVTVIPLSKGIFKDQLTYFTSSAVHLGSLVAVPVRNQTVTGLVIGIEDAQKAKTKIKTASFAIKKIEKVNETPVFSPAFIEAATITADHFATVPGAVISSLVPKAVLEAYANGAMAATSPSLYERTDSILKNEHYVFQSDDDERMATYKSFIRESFAKKRSVFFCLPSAQKIEQVYSALEKGIGPYTFVLHGKMSAKEICATWNNILASQRPVLIIATGGFLAIPREDIGAFILDLENSGGYKSSRRPFIDHRVFAERYAEKTHTKLIFGDIFLRVETLERERQKELIPFSPLKFRMLERARQYIIDMQEQDPSKKKTFTVISDELQHLIARTKENNEHLFVLASRRGLNPVTVCGDCGTMVKCSQCSAPMTLHKTGTKNIFLCHKCGNRRTSDMTCERCNSWKLTPLGIGTQLVEKEIGGTYPDMKVFVLDADAAPTRKKAQAIVSAFLSTPGSVLVGTEMAVSHLSAAIENVAVASIDSLFALPDFRGNERIFNLLLRLNDKASKTFLVQTRNAEAPLFKYLAKGNLLEFYRDEIAERKELGYPPFKTFIKITREGDKATVVSDMKALAERFLEYDALAFPAFIQEIRGKYRMHLLIKLDRGLWIDRTLLSTLRSLPLSYAVDIDPKDLL